MQHILDKGAKIYHQQAARLYLIRLAAQNPLSAIDIAYFAEERIDLAFNKEKVQGIPTNIQARAELTRAHVLARCQHIVESDKSGHLQILYRTIADFVRTRNVQKLLEA